MSEAEAPEKLDSADINRVLELLPHRYPMLMIDRIIEMNKDESAIGIKSVTNNEPFFQGHFPGHPVMPGVLIVEAMAQTAGALVINHLGTSGSNQLVYFMTVDRARFRKPVVPGDVLHVHVNKLQNRGTVWKYRGEGRVNGQLVAECELGAMIAGPVTK
ncbi:3-hydroxyacyl-ACP dehydratase FabZ [Parvibaculum sp.]|jgi:3-hydroxyacyl-[acyl-carrier-protein] dehydratase|uniref:3-hydroxyacyl-ACP dehydratase FabZ n=1 Tax=Parvibaculum sp. TaxID=2024848 RepID=UPI003C72EFCA